MPMLLLACVLVPRMVFADEAYSRAELDTEAVYLTRLAPFINWPLDAFSSPKSPMIICVGATDPLTGPVAKVAVREKDGLRPIRLRVISSSDDVDGCHILYLGAAGDLATQMERTLRHRPVLTVSRSQSGTYATAMIVFVLDHGRVRFDIDDVTAAGARLCISSKLLALARNVNPLPPQ